jgi:hypothetical protein
MTRWRRPIRSAAAASFFDAAGVFGDEKAQEIEALDQQILGLGVGHERIDKPGHAGVGRRANRFGRGVASERNGIFLRKTKEKVV